MKGSVADHKAQLRQRVRRHRRELGQRTDGAELARVLAGVAAAHGLQSSDPLAAYLPTAHEPDVLVFAAASHRAGGLVVMPRTLPGGGLEWVAWSPCAPLDRDRHGLTAPRGPADPAAGVRMRLILVPALAVDRGGRRLGQGGGYYDRALQHLQRWPAGPLRVAVVDAQWVLDDPLPHAPHDQPVDAIASPQGWWPATLSG